MFQRFKTAIDSRIAEEQARQRALQATPSRSNSAAKKPAARAASPAVRGVRNGSVDSRVSDLRSKGPDPSEFEPEFVIEDEEAISRAITPQPEQKTKQQGSENDESAPEPSGTDTLSTDQKEDEAQVQSTVPELPTDVRVKLRKFERLESRYQELLRSYRIAHARVSVIEPFEASLRENTPLISINDPSALVEYLNQVNLKGDMVLDELKRVTSEKDSIKVKLEDAERKTREAWDEVTRLKTSKASSESTRSETNDTTSSVKPAGSGTEQNVFTDTDEVEQSLKSPPHSAKTKTSSISGFSLFSPTSKPADKPVRQDDAEEFFSYDNELPRLEKELKEEQSEVNKLHIEVKTLKGDLSVARESTQSMVQTLEEATRELNVLRDRSERYESDLDSRRTEYENQINNLQSQLEAADTKVHQLETKPDTDHIDQTREQEKLLAEAQSEIENLRSLSEKNVKAMGTTARLQAEVDSLGKEIASLKQDKEQSTKRVETLNGIVNKVREDLTVANADNNRLKSEVDNSSGRMKELQGQVDDLMTSQTQQANDSSIEKKAAIETAQESKTEVEVPSSKKKNKKKKKGAKPSLETEADVTQATPQLAPTSVGDRISTSKVPTEELSRLQNEVEKLKLLVEEKDAAIERLNAKAKNSEELEEEIESLRDDLVNVGQEHVEAKDRIKELEAERASLQQNVTGLEKDIAEVRASHELNSTGSMKAHEDQNTQFEELRIKAQDLQTDLAVAQRLASSRFRELTELRTILQKAQHELSSLRTENGELKLAKDELNVRVLELQKVEVRHNALRAEVTDLRKKLSEKESENKVLRQKVAQESSDKQKAEELGSKATQDLQKAEQERRQISQALEKATNDLTKSREDLSTAKVRIHEIEESSSRLQRAYDSLKEEIELKTAQYVSAESLMSSMRDQTSEMATQTKEARERCESLEEEVADAHRLLSERSREGETMRRLLAEVEGRADSRMREMKDRMDTAIEERDRAEDEASTLGRRRAREVEEVRSKLRDVERSLKLAENEKEELEVAQRDWRKRREELEQRYEASMKEAEEVKKAMSTLRDTLDESEKQARDLEKQKTDLRRTVEDTQQRLDRLQKSNKALADEAKSMQARAKALDSQAQSPRSSLDSIPRSKAASPAAKGAPSGKPAGESNGQAVASTDYLKNILLQFLEQKDKKHQMQLIPVLGMLLHFDRKDEQKWMAAITAK